MNAEIDPAEAYARTQRGSFLLDVREQDEWEESHAKGATLVPLDQVEARAGEIPRGTEVLCMCRSGRRSAEAQKTLLRLGFEQVVNVRGGIVAWVEAGLPVKSGR